MASPLQNSAGLGACLTSNKNSDKSCIAQLLYKKVKFPVSELPTFCPLALGRENQKKRTRELRKQWKAWCSNDGSSGIVPDQFLPTPSATEVVKDFYVAFNAKDIQKLEQLLLPHCVYQDLVFYGHFEGKENIINFVRTVMEAMGPSIHIFVEEVTEVDPRMAAISCHLEWQGKKIPFTSGCRFFGFEQVEGRLLISKITGLEELPVKPGELALKVLKTVGTLFDRYPLAAEAMLKSYGSGSQDGLHEGMDMFFDWFGHKR